MASSVTVMSASAMVAAPLMSACICSLWDSVRPVLTRKDQSLTLWSQSVKIPQR
jgi:hypothetical protein